MAKAIRFYYEINVWVIHTAPNWTPEQAEHVLDLIESQIAEAIEQNSGSRPYWIGLAFTGRSTAEGVRDEKGRVYLHESMPVITVVNGEADREIVRNALTALLKGAVTAAQLVENHQVVDFSTQSPVVYVASAGSDRTGQ